MRINTLLHERHLLQAVQRGVITQEQAEALLALARSEAGGAGRMPDTGWLAIVQACVAAAVVGAVAVGNTEHTWRVTGTEEVVRGLGAMGLFLGLGLALRARRRVLLAGVGVALFALPPFAASEARLGDAAVAVAMLLGAVAVGVGAHYARRALVAQAAEGAGAEDERSVWG